MSLEAMRLIYFSYFHSVLSYGIIFWGNSVHSKYIFKIIKKEPLELPQILGYETLVGTCLKKLQILPLYSQYIYSLLMFVIKNKFT